MVQTSQPQRLPRRSAAIRWTALPSTKLVILIWRVYPNGTATAAIFGMLLSEPATGEHCVSPGHVLRSMTDMT
jgi:hypothetical protein